MTWKSQPEIKHFWGTEDKLPVGKFPTQKKKRDSEGNVAKCTEPPTPLKLLVVFMYPLG